VNNFHGIEIYEPTVVLGENFAYGDNCRIDSFVKIELGEKTSFGDCVHVASGAHIGIGGGVLVVGSHVTIASGVRVLTGSNTTDGMSMSAVSPASMQARSKDTTTLDDYSFIGVNAVVLPGVTVGRGAVVAAGAVVTKDVQPCTIVAGTPAVQIGYRKDLAKELGVDII
jgi:acetyltransferase-like isoleucine patch superfamily enzyme